MSIKKNASIADSVIRNTFYLIIQQIATFLFPLILTPLIISFIGTEQFGIYALVLGFITIFGLFDLSISSSFVVFFSRFIGLGDKENLNSYFSSGFFFYVAFSLLICTAAYLLRDPVLSILNIPDQLRDITEQVYLAGLLIFFINSVFSIYSSALISIQKMHITSVAGILGGVANFILTVTLLYLGYGLTGIVLSQFAAAAIASFVNFAAVKKHLPEIKTGLHHVKRASVKEMASFGSQMQLSKLAGFASEKYDEFLLAHFTNLSNVSFFNIASRISRTGRLIPFQIIPQIAPVAAGLKANEETSKLQSLFEAASKYLLLVTAPVFVYLFIFSDLVIRSWMGSGFETSALILKVLVIGQLINLTLSAPGNSIIPNTGYPKIQMFEGIINLALNVVISYLLIREYGILGAAIGSVTSTAISSFFVFTKSSGFFKKRILSMLSGIYALPSFAAAIAGAITYLLYHAYSLAYGVPENRTGGILALLFLAIIFFLIFALLVLKFKYLSKNDKVLIARTLSKIIPGTSSITKDLTVNNYEGELVSIFVVTHNRVSMLRKCIASLITTLNDINYELIIIDNASTDGTGEFLKDTCGDYPGVRIISNKVNIGVNAKSQGAGLCRGDFIIGIDDDVIHFPEGWIQEMVKAGKTIPRLGYLATDVVQDETTTGAKHPEDSYIREKYSGGLTLQTGPVGGWCFMISRSVYNDVGPLITFSDRIFFTEDEDYVNRVINKGYRFGILEGVCVYHACGEFHNREFKLVFEQKSLDHKRGFPLSYKIAAKIRNTFSFNRFRQKISMLAMEKLNW